MLGGTLSTFQIRVTSCRNVSSRSLKIEIKANQSVRIASYRLEVLPTGYGKSLIYEVFCLAKGFASNPPNASMIVIFPSAPAQQHRIPWIWIGRAGPSLLTFRCYRQTCHCSWMIRPDDLLWQIHNVNSRLNSNFVVTFKFKPTNHRRPKLSLWGVIIIFLNIFMRTISSWNELSWHSYRRHLLLHNDLTRNVTLAFQHVEVLCYNGLNLRRFVWGKTLKGILAEILIFFNKNDLPQCLVVFSIVLSLFRAIRSLLSELSLFEFPLLRAWLHEPGWPG